MRRAGGPRDVRDTPAGRALRGGLGLALAALGLGAAAASAQSLQLKPPPADPAPGDCPAFPAPVPARSAPPAAVDSLLTEGSRAAILGDHAAAEALLRRAAELDPTNPVVSYRLARTLDDEGRQEDAAVEYCRYLTLAPRAVDAEEVRERARSLLESAGPASEARWKADAREGIEAYAAGRHADAVAAFTRALDRRPDVAESFYNRGLAHLAAGSRAEAASDLEAYLRLSPGADDAGLVRAHLDRLDAQKMASGSPRTGEASTARPGAPTAGRSEPPTGRSSAPADSVAVNERGSAAGSGPSGAAPPPRRSAAPGRVLVQGLVVPGLGQLATGRALWGVGVLAAVGGSVFLALHEETVVRRMEAQDPFGNRYEYDVQALERPYQILGIGAAVGIGVAAAIESYVYARGRPATPGGGERRLSVAPTAEGVRLDVRVPFGPKPGSLRTSGSRR